MQRVDRALSNADGSQVMPVPASPDHRIHMLIYAWAVSGLGLEDIMVKLKSEGVTVDQSYVWSIVQRAAQAKR